MQQQNTTTDLFLTLICHSRMDKNKLYLVTLMYTHSFPGAAATTSEISTPTGRKGQGWGAEGAWVSALWMRFLSRQDSFCSEAEATL